MQVDPDWYVERVATDRDGDGIADTVVTVDATPVASAQIPTPVEESSAGSRIETPSDCNGTECYICAEGMCRVEFSTTATAPVVGHVEGSFLTIEFIDQLAEDPSSMDFEPIRRTEFFMSRWLHQADLPAPVPSP